MRTDEQIAADAEDKSPFSNGPGERPMTSPTIDEGLLRYFAAREQQRNDRANTAWMLLRPYERRLVREAAVMGYVLGHQDGRIDERSHHTVAEMQARFPKDFDIVRQVLEHCDSTADLYPYLGAAANGQRRRVTLARMWPGEAASHTPTTAEEATRDDRD